ncbi:hypothetical protein KO506_01585 [Polaribacter vadi]|uniref:hypothetical protein n=1 Tax=Polaribacter TaxID=52959 RepID=UPI001C0A04A9|nr:MULTISPECIES: hypothetical protein [Polaribacter]MBU3010092.1 hypothetical protein [Polaribacter vadi]MDO6739899.1 hypothetical protein [Polaribacter sp. 1_MG-2023]
MKSIKKITVITLILVGVLSFSKFENQPRKSSLNLTEVNVEDLLSKEELGWRPSSKVMFYVNTEIVKKSRGFSEIKANVYVLDRISGATNLLTSNNILLPYYKGSVIRHQVNNENLLELKNGDKIIANNINSTYSLNDLMKYRTIYESYIRSTNKLLNINRV